MTRIISILIVEDVDEMRHMIDHVLQGIPGIKVSGAARNGFEARLEVSRRRPDIIFLDEVLPGESSRDLLDEFISHGICVLLMTSLESPPADLPPGVSFRMVKPGWKSIQEDRTRIKKLISTLLKQSQA